MLQSNTEIKLCCDRKCFPLSRHFVAYLFKFKTLDLLSGVCFQQSRSWNIQTKSSGSWSNWSAWRSRFKGRFFMDVFDGINPLRIPPPSKHIYDSGCRAFPNPVLSRELWSQQMGTKHTPCISSVSLSDMGTHSLQVRDSLPGPTPSASDVGVTTDPIYTFTFALFRLSFVSLLICITFFSPSLFLCVSKTKRTC